MHAMINPSVVFDLFCVFIDDGVRVCVGHWSGFKFSVRGPQPLFDPKKTQKYTVGAS